MSPKKKYTFYISEELDQALKALKARDGISEAEAIRRALTGFLAEKGVLARTANQAALRRGRTRRKA
jgi:hypothetical protein